MNNQLVKLKALRKRCDSLTKQYLISVPTIDFKNLLAQFQASIIILNKAYPDILEGYQLQNYDSFYTENENYYSHHSVIALMNDITYYIDILSGAETVELPNFTVTKEGIYFAGEYFDALLKLTEIIKTATASIILIDGYVDEKVLSLFSAIGRSISIRILTKKKSLTSVLETLIKEYNKQYSSSLEIKTAESFHDRFLIIDEAEFYHIGASIKDAGNKGFMFSKIEEPKVRNLLIDEFSKNWA